MQGNLRNNLYQRYLINIVALYKQRKDIRNYLELLLSLVAVTLFIAFAIKPTLTTIGELIKKVQVEDETNQKLDAKIKNLGIAQNLYTQNQDKLQALDTAIPDNPEIQSYVRQIEGLIKKNSLTVITINASNVDLSEASKSGTPESLNTTFSLSGDYTNMENFIKDMETLRRPAIITKMGFTKDDKTLNLSITPQVPYLQ